jgi:hypothetical protein
MIPGRGTLLVKLVSLLLRLRANVDLMIQLKLRAKKRKKLNLNYSPNPCCVGKSLSSGMSLPPVLEATPHVRHVFRYGVASTATVSCTLASLLGACGGICTIANSKVQPWASSIRIRSLTVWPPSASGNYTFVNWSSAGSSGYLPDTAKMINIPDGLTITKALRFVPPKGSLAGNWLNPVTISTSAVIFGMTIHVGSVVDFHVEYTLSNVSQAGTITVVAGTLGNVYYLPLDGVSSNKLLAAGLPTTA